MLPDLDHIVRPDCPKCGAHTYLMRIMPRSAGMEVRWFECAKCSHVFDQLVKSVLRPRRDQGDPFRKICVGPSFGEHSEPMSDRIWAARDALEDTRRA